MLLVVLVGLAWASPKSWAHPKEQSSSSASLKAGSLWRAGSAVKIQATLAAGFLMICASQVSQVLLSVGSPDRESQSE